MTPTNFRMYPSVNQSGQGLILDHFLALGRDNALQKAWLLVEILLLVKLASIYIEDKKPNKGYHAYPWLYPKSNPPISATPLDSSESREPLLIGSQVTFALLLLLFSHSCLTLCDPMGCTSQASLPFTTSQSWPKLMSIESMMPSKHLPHFFSFTSHIK